MNVNIAHPYAFLTTFHFEVKTAGDPAWRCLNKPLILVKKPLLIKISKNQCWEREFSILHMGTFRGGVARLRSSMPTGNLSMDFSVL